MSVISHFTDISIALPQYSNSWKSSFYADVCEAARTNSYIETYGNKADTLHKYISFSDEKALKKAYETEVRFLIKRLNLHRVEIAIDGKQDLYYGKHGSIHVRGIVPENGAEEAWEYLVVSVVYPVKLPLMAIRYPMGADLAKCCIQLLEYVRSLPLKIEKILFDRGFYNGHLIDYLESFKGRKPLPYLIFVPKNEAVERYASQTKQSFGAFQHQIKYRREKSTWIAYTTVVICKNVGVNEKGEPYDWYFATNLKPSFKLVKQYKMRWNIETGFRIMEKGKIMTNSNIPIIRLFYFLFRALLSAVWLLSNMQRAYMTFKRFLKEAEIDLRRFEVNKPPAIKPIY